jgi:3-methylcrotonyl-CoA carboxylase alpha subunit
MFRKILIANRGEIACRVIATARAMGVGTVAVYSDADRGARHVAMADEAVRIGPALVAESYLRGDRIIAAALATGAEAIHPGYGFLSENPDFVAAVVAAGLTFIGPDAAAIRAMGLKDAAKALMQQAGVPVVPGYHGAEQDPGFLAGEAARIGWPVLIKARAGGGGKGMRRVDRPEDFAEALASARREAAAAFGDPACLIEKYITQPRHIEIQIFGDTQGHVIHLLERDCSLQRRHQKVIEEAPAPGMTPDLRAAMGGAAVEAARAIGYRGAGTVEFIVDGAGPLRADGFWFMEMNTRLQVEHPVSEAITGLDFVEWQLRIAAGEPLPLRQEEVTVHGHAVEARLYAEDAAAGFLPATGRLDHLEFPEATEFRPGPLRIDSGVRQGDAVSPWYDPLLAKIIAEGPTRAIALQRLSAALRQCRVAGTVTNLGFLAALTDHAGFRSGAVDTGLIARDLEGLLHHPEPPPHVIAAAALAVAGLLASPDPSDPWQALQGWRLWPVDTLPVTLMAGDVPLSLRVAVLGGRRFAVEGLTVEVVSSDGGRVVLALPDRLVTLEVLQHGRQVTVWAEGNCHSFALPDPQAADAAGPGADAILAPMPGLVTRLAAVPGQIVARGEVLAVLEAMKMEHALAAPRDGVVARVLASVGDQVSHGALLLDLEAEDG